MTKIIISNVSGIIFLENGNILLLNGRQCQLLNQNTDLPRKIVPLHFHFDTGILSWVSLYD